MLHIFKDISIIGKSLDIGSDVTARLGLEAVALAWLSRARA